MLNTPWVGALLGAIFLTLGVYELRSGRAFSKFGTLTRSEAPFGYWAITTLTLALAAFSFYVSILALAGRSN